jgi:BirA family biotin operon repressor/biotin-[acetyl-CoA-carboxylase] ligase
MSSSKPERGRPRGRQRGAPPWAWPPPLDEARLAARQGWSLHWRERLGSTMDAARTLAREGAGLPCAVVTREQTGGRGRRGRPFVSPPGGLYLTAAVPALEPAGLSWRLGFAAATAAFRALERLGAPLLAFDWPNDVVLREGGKVGGFLSELLPARESASGAPERATVLVGVGLNVGAPPERVDPGEAGPACWLNLDPPAAIAATCGEILETLGEATPRLGDDEAFRDVLNFVRQRWLPLVDERHATLRIRRHDGSVVEGRGVDLREDGAVVLRRPSGERFAIRYGEVVRD